MFLIIMAYHICQLAADHAWPLSLNNIRMPDTSVTGIPDDPIWI